MTHRVAVTCVGIAVCDIIVTTPSHVVPGFLHLVEGLTIAEGGCALRTSRALAGMGVETTLVAPIGRDLFGDVLRASALHPNLRTEWVEVSEATSSSAILVDDDGGRTIYHHIGANAALTPDHINAADGVDIFHVGGAFALPGLDGDGLTRLFATARAHGSLTSLDVVYDAGNDWSLVKSCLPLLDLFCPSLEEAEAITGATGGAAAAEALHANGVRVAVVTDGARGCWVASSDIAVHIPAYRVATVDTTGAGDAFTAGVLTGFAHRLAPIDAARLGAAVGALATTTTETFAGPDDPRIAWELAGLEIPT